MTLRATSKRLTGSEADLAREVVTELQRQGYDTYEEVASKLTKRADIVAVRDRILMVVETKTTLSFQLLEQCQRWCGFAHYIIAAVPIARRQPVANVLLRHLGVGLWTVGCGEIHEQQIAPRLDRTALVHWLRGALREEQRSGGYAAAGSSGGGYWTPFRGTCDELRRVVTAEPGITLRDALGRFDHHYSRTLERQITAD